MHIVLINQYYPPDEAPTGLMLEYVAGSLIDQGHQVTILCSSGGYAGSRTPEPADARESAVRIVRIRATRFGRGGFAGKLADYLTFYIRVARELMAIMPGPDRIIALTTPPYLSILARLASKFRGCDHAHWVMDLYPDVMFAHGMLRRKSIAGAVLSMLSRWGFGGSRCRVVMTLGPDMAERIRKHLHPETLSVWVPLWGTTDEDRFAAEAAGSPVQPEGTPGSHPPTGEPGGSPLVLMYSGNMGLGHRFAEFLRAAKESGPNYEWRFNGGGKRRHEIEDFIRRNPESPVSLGPYVSRDHLTEHLKSADVHLVSMEPSWNGTMVPSKLPAIFSLGLPAIFVGSPDCSVGQWIHESGGGWVVPPDDIQAMDAALREAILPAVRFTKGESARRFAAVFFNGRNNALKVASIFSEAPDRLLESIGCPSPDPVHHTSTCSLPTP